MLQDVVAVKPLDAYRLHLVFEDGAKGIVDVSELITFTAIFEPLKQQDFFSRVSVDPKPGTIVWPNDADLDPDVLYSLVTGEPIALSEPALA